MDWIFVCGSGLFGVVFTGLSIWASREGDASSSNFCGIMAGLAFFGALVIGVTP